VVDNDSHAPADEKVAGRRLMSVDALRGFDMFWIAGGEIIVRALRELSDVPFVHFLASQLRHARWEGFTFYDLVFPLFIFIAGVSIVFSLNRLLATEGRRAAMWRVLRRSVLLFLLGIFHSGGFAGGWEEFDLTGVLQHIAVCYLFAGLLFLHLRVRGLIVAFVVLVVGYWALLMFVPVPDVGAGHIERGRNLTHYVDRHLQSDGRYHNEGFLTKLPGTASCLAGVFAGLLLQSSAVPERRKVLWLLVAGVAAVELGFLWGYQFPVIKPIWTSSYVLVAGGFSAILLGVCYQVIEIWQYRRWAMPFVWFGTNCITIYMVENVIEAEDLVWRLVGGPVAESLGVYTELAGAVILVAVATLFVRFLYNRKIFLRL